MKHFFLFCACLSLSVQTDTAAATPAKFEQPNAYAVVIGISQYREDVVAKIPYASKDAEAIAQVLEVQGGIPKTHIKLLTDSKATNTDIRNHVNDWLRMRVKPDSIVYIYYAGHGTPNPQTGEVYLVPWEGHPDFPSGLYPLKEFYAALNKLPAKEIVVMLDSCFSGAPGRSVLAKGTRPMVISLENPLLAGGKIAVLSASTGNQMSSDYDKAGHGLFTHFLLAGLGGAADKDKNHLVTLKELYPYVREQVSETAVEEFNREQTPMLLPGEDALGVRAGQALVQVVPGFSPSITAKTDAPKPIQEARVRPYETPRQAGKEIIGRDGAPMVLVPEGEFLYGDDRQWKSLSTFYLDKYEVSTKLYAAFFQATNREKPKFWNEVRLVSHGDRPVVGVTWHDADAYCRHYGKRLPREQEWEKAARGTDGRKYPWGSDEPTSRHANFGKGGSDQYDILVNVGTLEDGKSPYGIYDLAGNVWEWTSSDYDSSQKVIRGGSWSDAAYGVVTTNRYWYRPTGLSNNIGFRCAQDAPDTSEAPKAMEVAHSKPYEAPQTFSKAITGKDGAPMVLVPEGEFLYGDEKQRKSLAAFYMDKFEVTTRLYAKFLPGSANPLKWPKDWIEQNALVGAGDRPVTNVSWDDADAYCRAYGKRLPTEEEWEKAARGTDGRKYPWGDEEPTSRHALFDTQQWKGYGTLAVVGSHEAGASPYGIHDLAGNVWEWTSSDINITDKVIRGGSWNMVAYLMRTTFREVRRPSDIYVWFSGFRCAQDVSK